jgi:hypothetical protein
MRCLRPSSVKKRKGDQAVPQNQPACACTDCIQEREWMLEKLKVINSKVNSLAMKLKKAEEELKRIKTRRRK